MSIAACLLLYSIAVCLIGPPVLRRLTRRGYAPRLSVAAWLIAIASVLISWLMASCLAFLCDVIFGHAGRISQILLVSAAAGGGIAVSVGAIRIVRSFVHLRACTREHADAVRLVGRPISDDGVFVIDAPERAAYCVSTRPPVIVVTTGALASLDADQLGAVLAHERAHLSGHHHLILTTLRSIAAAVFSKLALMTHGTTEVARMLEMCADDSAAHRFGHRALLSGLMSLAGAAPAGAMGAAGVATLSRAERLAIPATPPTRLRARAALIDQRIGADRGRTVGYLCADGIWHVGVLIGRGRTEKYCTQG